MASFPGQKAGAAPVAPTTPSNLTATPLVSGTQILLQWNPSLDGDVSVSYIISRCSGASCTNFSPVITTVPNAVNYLDNGLTQTTSYSYTVQAIDGSGNLSGVSSIATATTPVLSNPQTLPTSPTNTGNRWPFENWLSQIGARVAGILAPIQDLTAPTVPASFIATAVSGVEIDLSWTASTDPDDSVSKYNIVRNPGGVNITVLAPTTTFHDTGLSSSTTYSYTISATDTNANTSATAAASATTQFVDTTPPTIPANFLATTVSTSAIDLSWTASTDPDDSVSVYTITRNPGNVTITVNAPATLYHDVGLVPSTNYIYTISATDQHNNTSNTSSTSATTQSVSSFSPNFPRTGFMGIGTTTDNYYGNATVTVQRLGSVPILTAYGSYNIFVLGADFEGWNNSGSRDRQILVTNIKNSSTANLGTKVGIYGKMDSFRNDKSDGYTTWENVVLSNNWTLYSGAPYTAGGSTEIIAAGTPPAQSYYVDYAENSSGVAFVGNDAQGETPAQFAAHYQFYKSLNKNRTGTDASRFAAINAANAATNLDFIQMDNFLIDSRVAGDWQRNGTQSTHDNGSYQGIWSDMLIKGQADFCNTLRSLVTGAGQSQWIAMNGGDYARADAGTTLSNIGVMGGVCNYSFFESAFGKSFSIETFNSFAGLLNDSALLESALRDPFVVMWNCALPDATTGPPQGLSWSATQTAVNGEFQWARYMTSASYMRNAYCAIESQNTGGVNYRANGVDLRWYDEFDNAGASKGWLGQPMDPVQTNIRTWYDGTTIPNVYAREFVNGLVICVARSGSGSTFVQPTGTITITGSQLGLNNGKAWVRINGTQAPAVNNGAAVTAAGVTLQASRDGIFLVKPAPLAITNVNPLTPQATTGTAYAKQMNASGGVPPYTWQPLSGVSPNTGSWLSITSAGVLGGTPGKAEVESMTVTVKDSASNTASGSFSLTVASNLAITTASLPAGTAGTAYSSTLAASGGTTPYTWSITAGKPTWMSISTAGVISGTPSAAESDSITFQVSDNFGNFITKVLPLTVNAASSFVPLQHFSADSFAVGTAPNVSGGAFGQPQLYTTLGTGAGAAYGSKVVTTLHRTGKTSSVQVSIQSGTSGFPGDGETPAVNGLWGAEIYPPSSRGNAAFGQQGQYYHFGIWMYVSSATNLATTSLTDGAQKFLLDGSPNTGGTTGKDDIHICTNQAGFAMLNEYDPNNTANNSYPSSRTGVEAGFPRDQWFWLERGKFLQSNGDLAIDRVWVNDVLQLERNGRVMKWRTTDGVYHTQTLAQVGCPNLPTATASCEFTFLFTYWNAHPTGDQQFNWSDIVTWTGTSESALPNVDSLGNRIIGSSSF
jgi:hypothetical protein